MLNKLLRMASFRDDEAGYRGILIEDERSEGLITQRTDIKTSADAEFIRYGNVKDIGTEAFCMWPSDIELAIPKEWKAGDKVPAVGPHGRIFFEVPDECVADSVARFRLKPVAEMRVEVPPGVPAGGTMNFERPDGTRISIKVPQGKKQGDYFEVTPPSVMVLVPEEAKAGDTVVFSLPGPPPPQWFQAKVPETLQLGKYFAARLPPPDNLAGKGGGKGSVSSDQMPRSPAPPEAAGPVNAVDEEVPVE